MRRMRLIFNQLRRQLTILRIGFTLITVVSLYYLISLIYSNSYAWQSTSLAKFLRPVSRTTCPLPVALNFDGNAIDSTNKSALRIVVVMIYDDAFDSHKSLTQGLLSNRRAYCEQQGYEMIVATQKDIDKSRPAAWSKLLIVLKHLPKFDLVFYMDMDVVITNPHVSLRSISESYPLSDIIMTADWSGPNTGLWFARNTKWTADFLRLAWSSGEPLVPKYSRSGAKHPFEYEQRVFHMLLGTNLWRERGLPQYSPPDGFSDNLEFSSSAHISSHVAVAPQCLFNSFIVHPLDSRLLSGTASVEISQWVPGDFVVHFAGKKGRAKTDLIRHFLRLADSVAPP